MARRILLAVVLLAAVIVVIRLAMVAREFDMIGNWSRLRRKVEALIPDEVYGSRIGTTDSEAVFLAILGAGGDKDPVGATARVLATITDMVVEGGAMVARH